ncbi:unnamed protein product [Lampetra planeri]
MEIKAPSQRGIIQKGGCKPAIQANPRLRQQRLGHSRDATRTPTRAAAGEAASVTCVPRRRCSSPWALLLLWKNLGVEAVGKGAEAVEEAGSVVRSSARLEPQPPPASLAFPSAHGRREGRACRSPIGWRAPRGPTAFADSRGALRGEGVGGRVAYARCDM